MQELCSICKASKANVVFTAFASGRATPLFHPVSHEKRLHSCCLSLLVGGGVQVANLLSSAAIS